MHIDLNTQHSNLKPTDIKLKFHHTTNNISDDKNNNRIINNSANCKKNNPITETTSFIHAAMHAGSSKLRSATLPDMKLFVKTTLLGDLGQFLRNIFDLAYLFTSLASG